MRLVPRSTVLVGLQLEHGRFGPTKSHLATELFAFFYLMELLVTILEMGFMHFLFCSWVFCLHQNGKEEERKEEEEEERKEEEEEEGDVGDA